MSLPSLITRQSALHSCSRGAGALRPQREHSLESYHLICKVALILRIIATNMLPVAVGPVKTESLVPLKGASDSSCVEMPMILLHLKASATGYICDRQYHLQRPRA